LIGLDTNVLVRYIAQDDPRQASGAVRLIEHECSETHPGFLSVVALVELVWVLETCYTSTKAEIVAILQRVLRSRQLVVQSADVVWQAVRLYEGGSADFADCLIDRIAAANECEYTATFDKEAAKAGLRLLE
jgi:predicted nucleic-acid-binding protein